MVAPIVDDFTAFDQCAPQDRKWYGKLYVARYFGYNCGSGTIREDGEWIVRPITNLAGQGLDATIGWHRSGDPIPPNFFWCEVFTGRHITIDYIRSGEGWVQSHTFQGFNTQDDLIRFSHWKRVDYPFPLPSALRGVESDHINLELIGGNIIEVHLRPNSDPVQYDEFWPIWRDDQPPPSSGKWVRIQDQVTHIGRLGFYVPG
jgi:hypothetical protein